MSQIDQNQLKILISNIMKNATSEKVEVSLTQLYEIIENSGADQEMLEMLKKCIDDAPELSSIYKANGNRVISDDDIRIAEQRARDRKIREQEAIRYGRC